MSGRGARRRIARIVMAGACSTLWMGGALLSGLEEKARTAGIRAMRLETASLLTEAIALYRSAGYRE